MTVVVRELVGQLGLEPHPEGGWFREIFRSAERIRTGAGRERSATTVIWYLLGAGEGSRWHLLDADETWCHAGGGAMELFVLDPGSGVLTRFLVGPLGPGSEPVAVVPAGHWQAARPVGGHALVTCHVAPGFEFAGFRLAADDPAARELVRKCAPGLLGLVDGGGEGLAGGP